MKHFFLVLLLLLTTGCAVPRRGASVDYDRDTGDFTFDAGSTWTGGPLKAQGKLKRTLPDGEVLEGEFEWDMNSEPTSAERVRLEQMKLIQQIPEAIAAGLRGYAATQGIGGASGFSGAPLATQGTSASGTSNALPVMSGLDGSILGDLVGAYSAQSVDPTTGLYHCPVLDKDFDLGGLSGPEYFLKILGGGGFLGGATSNSGTTPAGGGSNLSDQKLDAIIDKLDQLITIMSGEPGPPGPTEGP